MNYFLAFLGFILYIGLGMMKTKRKYTDRKFDPVKYLKDELITIIVSGISVLILMIALPDVIDLYFPGYIKDGKILSSVIGFSGYTIFDKIVNIVLPKKFTEK